MEIFEEVEAARLMSRGAPEKERFMSRWATAGGFGEAVHEVEILDGDSGGSLDEVVEGGENDQLLAAVLEGDVAEVGEGDVFGRREMVDDPHEGFPFVEAAVEFGELSPPSAF